MLTCILTADTTNDIYYHTTSYRGCWSWSVDIYLYVTNYSIYLYAINWCYWCWCPSVYQNLVIGVYLFDIPVNIYSRIHNHVPTYVFTCLQHLGITNACLYLYANVWQILVTMMFLFAVYKWWFLFSITKYLFSTNGSCGFKVTKVKHSFYDAMLNLVCSPFLGFQVNVTT